MEAQALLQEQKLQESRALENTIAFQEALIEERDHGIAGVLVIFIVLTIVSTRSFQQKKATDLVGFYCHP